MATTLAELPVDIFLIMTDLLDGTDIYHLFVIGNSVVRMKLANGGVKTFHLLTKRPTNEMGLIRWPSILSYLQSLLHLSILLKHGTSTWFSIDFTIINPNLLSLTMDAPYIRRLSSDGQPKELFNFTLPQILPHLTYLSIRNVGYLLSHHTPMLLFIPPSVTNLQLLGISEDLNEVLPHIPNHLRVLNISVRHNSGKLTQTWVVPSSLTSLRFTGHIIGLVSLPSTLTSLKLSMFEHNQAPQSFIHLPRTITELEIVFRPWLTSSLLSGLPSCLQHLTLLYSKAHFDVHLASALPTQLRTLDLEIILIDHEAIFHLPRSITFISDWMYIPHDHNLQRNCLDGAPPALTTLIMRGHVSNHEFPSTLTHLGSKKANMLKLSTVTTRSLPRGLTQLHAHLEDIEPSQSPLPPFLTSLTATVLKIWPLATFTPLLIHLDICCPDMKGHMDDLETMLPSTLVRLHLRNFPEWSPHESLWRQLSKLLHLRSLGIYTCTDFNSNKFDTESLRLLPRTLEQLSLPIIVDWCKLNHFIDIQLI
jgi:hypothetical protein